MSQWLLITNYFKDFKGDTYEVVSYFVPGKETTAVGFNLRVGDGQATKSRLRFN